MPSELTDSPSQGRIDLVSVQITLREHLAHLEASEASKWPNQRKEVPGIPDLAAAAGVSRQAMYNIASRQVKMINLEILSAIINELRRRGFATEVSDLLTAYPLDAID